jgi:hypothetical protein
VTNALTTWRGRPSDPIMKRLNVDFGDNLETGKDQYKKRELDFRD